MYIVNPTFGQAAGGGEALATRAVDWTTDPIALFSNSKPNARDLLEGVRDSLSSFRSIDNIDYVQKDSVSQPAPVGIIEQVAKNYRAAVLAIAD